MRLFLVRTFPLWAGAGLYLFFILYGIGGVQVPDVPASRDGPLLFWQAGALYTINPNGTNLTKLTPALLADRRVTEVSPGCNGLAPAACWVLVGHVLYHISGRGVPLPLTPNTEWINAPAGWSPDGVHLAYTVGRKDTNRRALLVYNTALEIVWRVAAAVDESRTPAWSPGCANGLMDGCVLAFGKQAAPGQAGSIVAAFTFADGSLQSWNIPNHWGHILKWSPDNRLYVGGSAGWFRVDDGSPVKGALGAEFASSVAPTVQYVAYSGRAPRAGQRQIWLAGPSQPPFLIDAVPIHPDRAGFSSPVIWSPGGEALAAFNQGRLIYYNLVQQTVSVWYRTDSMDVLKGYAFAPSGNAIALVEGQYLDNPERPQNRLFIVYKSGEVVNLRLRSREPIVLMAWLPAGFDRYPATQPFDATS
ncbi:MAG: hypothetical protein ACE5G8_01935 [Anaerolineae bacterium]